jgi:hypothetical protein
MFSLDRCRKNSSGWRNKAGDPRIGHKLTNYISGSAEIRGRDLKLGTVLEVLV